jgi:hypothetical protein
LCYSLPHRELVDISVQRYNEARGVLPPDRDTLQSVLLICSNHRTLFVPSEQKQLHQWLGDIDFSRRKRKVSTNVTYTEMDEEDFILGEGGAVGKKGKSASHPLHPPPSSSTPARSSSRSSSRRHPKASEEEEEEEKVDLLQILKPNEISSVASLLFRQAIPPSADPSLFLPFSTVFDRIRAHPALEKASMGNVGDLCASLAQQCFLIAAAQDQGEGEGDGEGKGKDTEEFFRKARDVLVEALLQFRLRDARRVARRRKVSLASVAIKNVSLEEQIDPKVKAIVEGKLEGWGNRGVKLARLAALFTGKGENDPITFPSLALPDDGGLLLPTWWGSQADNDLLVGTYRHGFGAYEALVADQKLCFSGASLSDESEKPAPKRPRRSTNHSIREAEKIHLPSRDILDERCDELLGLLDDSAVKEAETLPTRMQLWTKTERHTLRVALQAYGMPQTSAQWDMFATLIAIHTKTVEQIKAYCAELEHRANSEAGTKKRGRSDKKRGGAYDDDEFTPIIAKTLQSRLITFGAVREIVQHKELYVVKLQNTRADMIMPKWWSIETDLFLLETVAAYGAGKKGWDLFLAKEDNPFLIGANEAIKEERLTFLKHFVSVGKVPLIFDRLDGLTKACGF